MGRGAGCCGDDRPSVATFAGDNRTAEELGLPPGVEVRNPSRHCISTDCPMLIIFILFWIGMFVIADYGYTHGDPWKLVYGTDYRAHRCGDSRFEPDAWNASIAAHNTSRFRFQSPVWTENTLVWYPVPFSQNLTRESMAEFDVEQALALGVCVSECPQFGLNFTAEEVLADRDLYAALNGVFTYGTDGKDDIDTPPEVYNVWYNSQPTLRRCVPDRETLEDISEELKGLDLNVSGAAHVSGFFEEGLGEVEESTDVLIIGCAVALVTSYILVAVLYPLVLKPLIWIMLVAVVLLLGAGGYFSYRRYDDLSSNSTPDDDNEADGFAVLSAILWAACFIAFCLFVWFAKQVNAACDIINAAGKVMIRDLSLLLVPLVVLVFALVLLVFIVDAWLHVYTIHDDTEIDLVYNSSFSNNSYVVPEEYSSKRNMMYYIVFGWFWTYGTLSAMGFFAVAVSTMHYYYSNVNDDKKGLTCCFPWLKGFGWALLFHAGALVTGALLVAIVQMIRFILYHTAQKLSEMSDMMKCLVCIVDCCLGCVERFLQYVTQNAYVVTAIEGSGFWPACCATVDIMMDSVAYLGPLSLISSIVFFVTRVVVCAVSLYTSYWIFEETDVAPQVKNMMLPLVVIGGVSYFIVSVFINVYESVIDSMCILVFHELSSPKDPALYFCPGFIFKTVTGKDKSEASVLKAALAAQAQQRGQQQQQQQQ